MMAQTFKIVVPSYNCAEWLPDCLQSVADQTYKNYDVIVIDDASTDERQRGVIEQFVQRNGWKALCNEEHVGAMANIVNGIHLLDCEPEDIVLILDGDDWLFNADVLSKLNAIYATGEMDLTYGQYQNYPDGKKGYCRPVSQEVIVKRNYRRARWSFYQLRTFKHFLWEAIRDEDLRDITGEYVSVAYDVAMMFPMLEMVGERFRFIDEILYVYNIANPINDHKMRKKFLHETERYLRQKPKYNVLKR